MECDSEYFFGLIGSPHRALVVKEMERQLEAPDHPISQSFIQALSLLAFTLQHPEPLPPYPTGDDSKIKLRREQLKRREDLYKELMARYLERLAAAVLEKRGQARAISLHTLLELKWNRCLGTTPRLPTRIEGLPNELVSVFHQLPPQAQYTLLKYRWKRLAGLAMLPILRRIYENPPESVRPWQIADIREIALRRLYELAPDEGRRLILEEIRSPTPCVGINALGLLPDQTLPELDEVLAENLERSLHKGRPEIHSLLVGRYATPRVLPRIKAVYGAGECWAKSIQSALLAYFLRADPAFGAEMVRKAFDVRTVKHRYCYPSLLDVAQLHMSPELEQIAIAYLADPDPEVAANAAAMLGRHGSEAAEEHLWRRLEKWHEEWKGREDELRYRIAEDNPNQAEVRLETALWQALAYAPAWLSDREKLRRLQGLCVTRNARRWLNGLILGWTDEIRINFQPAGGEEWRVKVAQYEFASISALKEKLAQFPSGTAFIWQPQSAGESEEERLFLELQGFLKVRGMKLEK